MNNMDSHSIEWAVYNINIRVLRLPSTDWISTTFQKKILKICLSRVCTLFSETNFQDFFRTEIDFSRTLKFTLTPTFPRSQFSLLPSIHFIFLVEFNRFPKRPRTIGLFPGLSSPGKCHNKIKGLSRFSRIHMNPAFKSQARKGYLFSIKGI